MQLLIGDAVRGRVRWGLDWWSALGERLVYGCPLTTGNQTLWRICVPGFTEEGRELIRKNWQNCYIIGSVTDEDFTWGTKSVWDERWHAWDYFQPVVLADVFTERWATRSRWGWGQPQVFCRRNTAGLGGGKLQHKLQHVRQRILGGARAVVFVAVNRPRTQSKQYLLPQHEEVYQVISHKKQNKTKQHGWSHHSSFCWRVASCSLSFFTSPLLSLVCFMFLWRYLFTEQKSKFI